jgi:hypothetical protein
MNKGVAQAGSTLFKNAKPSNFTTLLIAKGFAFYQHRNRNKWALPLFRNFHDSIDLMMNEVIARATIAP